MALTPMSDNLNIIAALADEPNATSGLTAAQFKAKFDEGPGLLKTYVNNTLVPAIDEAQNGSVMRQAAINGNFAVNQLVVSGTVTLAAGAYGHDMWKAGASGCTYTFSTSNNVTTITITAGSLIQVVEGLNLYSGTYTLSWTGTAQGKIGSGSYGASGVTGTVVGGTNTNIEFNTGTLSKVQFNAGSIALPFQPRSFAEELALCQRYYEKSYDYATAIRTVTGNGFFVYRTRTAVAASTAGNLEVGMVYFKVRKRTTPTVQMISTEGTLNAIRLNGGSPVRTGATAGNIGHIGFANIAIDATSANPINLDAIVDFHWTADARL